MDVKEKILEIKKVALEATPGPWFLHDFTDASINPDPKARDVTVSCDHPATITVAEMGGGLWGHKSLEQARKDAKYISVVNPETILIFLSKIEELEGLND